MHFNKSKASNYMFFSSLYLYFFLFPCTLMLVLLTIAAISTLEILLFFIFGLISTITIRHFNRVLLARAACRFTLSCEFAIAKGVRLYSDFAMISKFDVDKIEQILVQCLKNNLISGITLDPNKKMIIPVFELNNPNNNATSYNKNEKTETYLLSCVSCGAKYSTEILKNDTLVKCEYCGNIYPITKS